MRKEYAVLYIRVSTEDQIKGLSLDVQRALCTKKAEDEGFEVLEVFDDGGKSGFKERPGILRIQELIEEGKVSALVALSSDRLFRNARLHMEMMTFLFKHGTKLLYVHQASPNESPDSVMSDPITAVINQYYRDQVSYKVKASLNAKARAGYFPTMVPPGYKSIENPDKSASPFAKKIAVHDPIFAPVIMELFRKYATGLYSVYDLTDTLVAKGMTGRLGGTLSANRVYDLLRNRFYIGEIHWGEVHNPNGHHDPLIDTETFNTVQMVLKVHNKKACRRRKYQWLLSGFLWCDRHGRRYCAEWHMKKKKAYYHCPNRLGCGKYMEQVFAEETIADKFKDLEFSEEFQALVLDKVRRIFLEKRKGHEGRRQGVVNRRTGLEQRRRVIETKLMDGVLSDDAFTRMRDEIDSSLGQVELELLDIGDEWDSQVDIAREVLLITKNILKAYKRASFELKRHYLGFFWDRFEVYDGVILKSVSTPLFEQLQQAEQAYFMKAKPRKASESKALSTGILSTSRLRD